MLTHILRHIFQMQAYRIPLVVGVGVMSAVFLGHYRINLHQTRMQYSNEKLQHCNHCPCLISENRFLNLEF